MFSEKSNIAFIGAGKIAFSLVSALLKAGYNVTSIISRNKNSAKKLAGKFKVPDYSNNLKFLTNETKIFFLTVPDSQIKKTAKEISKLDLDFKGSLFIHVSGALDISELKSLKKKKAHTGSFHIMQTFPSTKIVDIKNCSVAIEAEKKVAKDFLNKLALDLKLKPFYLRSDKKIYYHLAGVLASNFLVGNLFSAEKMFRLTKPKKVDFFSVVNSTVNSTLDNIRNVGPAKALSGPVERGDYETIEKHLKALKGKDKLLFLNYLIQSLYLLEVTGIKNGKLNKEHKKIHKILVKEFNLLKKL
ncbi:MAG: hypothetical protein A2V93_00995 [Ignavibacteria bacterium RBG_16_34_14]|nr:MAG: hypothetical protein A2V93_00995 [Ignavibacteria bacterium RBG_16_34_14]